MTLLSDLEPDSWPKPAPSAEPEEQSEQGLTAWSIVAAAGVATVVGALLLRLFVLHSYHIPTDSMISTLLVGDRVVVNELSYRFGEVERGQVVVFERPANAEPGSDVIKRVIGLPGETIRLVDGEVYVGPLRVVEPYLLEPASTEPVGPIPGCAQPVPSSLQCVVPAGHVFVLGDNRTGSSDSRTFGPIPIESIVGRAFLRVWPLSSIGRL